ncbi:MAG TPA: enoyl-CoA hydratase-related protein [Pseudomonadales bacterium]|jgi:enoyl-CoA hydratase/carnithine racemase|nr:enoyl-CoA hydratase [Gammaproteobacteria bacterium]MDP6025238.1 enoyl-CoA hydratase-related protein [Pseudomonadales bacterium]MDP6315319.1 enoyl-CoA hydratase-related protein [Pseudomonadales bacterium]MDP7314767.1 enoyl-CoA hydratase-related protein [Pseudomonadales bacterium]MDP7577193.1 enoyl-CoA hydratase-related protein [Pseudomonadales bacterium]|tara:strand:- start:1021 stop:1839 length:819 start_codon:yes stop_codon:yes gene_type:complete
MEYEEITYDVGDRIATIKFNRPHAMNAGTGRTYWELEQAFRAAAVDDEVNVIVLTGVGRAFCAGDDVNQLFLSKPDNSDEARSRRLLDQIRDLGSHRRHGLDTSIIDCPKPTIAAVNGAAVGYGCDIALMCDMRIGSDHARMGEFFVRRGLIPSVGGLMLLPRIIGLARAYELILSGRLVEAEELAAIGMVNRIVPHDDLEEETQKFASVLSAQAPIGQMLAKEGIRMGMNWDYDKLADYSITAIRLLMQTADHHEGALSFAEKREAEFKGR